MRDRELKRMLEQAVFNTSEKASSDSVHYFYILCFNHYF